MTRLYGLAGRAAGVLAGVSAVLAVLAVPSAVRGDAPNCPMCTPLPALGTQGYYDCMMCESGGGGAATCSSPNAVKCTVDDPTNPSDCNAATKNAACDTKDNKCVCRFSRAGDCTCGYLGA